jgi:predicted dehydrogenase
MLDLGVVGLSPGNGHPYSWSAIVNGDYDEALMADCGFPVIPAYLRANRDTLGIEGARVRCVWTQDRALSAKVAACSRIPVVVDRLEEMLGAVDAVLLARDDPGNHVAMAKPFLDAGIPIFIDKPLAATWADLDYFAEQQAAGRFVMSCSSFRYSAGVQAVRVSLEALGELELAVVVGNKDWVKYGIHWLEGLYALLSDPQAVAVRHVSRSGKDIVTVEFVTGLLATVHVFQDMAPGGELTVYGRKGSTQVNHGGTYTMFRATLEEAIRSFREKKPRLDFAKTRNLMATLIGARESLERGGAVVRLA